MKRTELTRLQGWFILGGAALMLSLGMGMRQSWGLFQPHMIRDLGITAADFSLALAIQNIVWGVTQPFVGMLADRHGSRLVALGGTLIYAAGLLFSLLADSVWMLTLGLGIFIGIALSCTTASIAMSVTARTVSPLKLSVALGSVSALGSLGTTFVSPLAQSLNSSGGWQLAMVAFLGLTAVMLPAAFFAGGADKIEIESAPGTAQSIGEAVREAADHSGYIVMATAFFVCGLQLVFLITHLPTYLELCGMDPTVGSTALALIGLFNVGGSYLFGWLGGRHSKRVLLGGIYVMRSLFIAAYFLLPPSPTSTLVFAAAMGTLWLGVIPLMNGLVVHLFGLRFLATLTGIAFLSHQVGSFIGAWGGGLIYSVLGSYDMAWKSAVAIGIIAGLFQMTMNTRPTARVMAERRRSLEPVAQAG
ncbi:MAG: MFS transporter [Betaproteobacteria bacterium RIFCSPLOWO2_02_FULL_64_12]|nr:MAG: MFS transporter [Betaproteobacteria bacterium RIFCSPLOWO2_02_FULL_64_12]